MQTPHVLTRLQIVRTCEVCVLKYIKSRCVWTPQACPQTDLAFLNDCLGISKFVDDFKEVFSSCSFNNIAVK